MTTGQELLDFELLLTTVPCLRYIYTWAGTCSHTGLIPQNQHQNREAGEHNNTRLPHGHTHVETLNAAPNVVGLCCSKRQHEGARGSGHCSGVW